VTLQLGESTATGVPTTRSTGGLATHSQGQSLADVLERVLDKGIVIVGDIQVRLLDIELLTIKIRLMVASVDKAREMGIDWWEVDPFFSSGGSDDKDDKDGDEKGGGRLGELAQRGRELEQRVGDETSSASKRPSASRRRS